ncbi:MAG: HD domain-containing protein [Betaproteobacteria bacterium]|nr:HD domain-containing protein [Betaproteobacteria bacterium]
MNNQTDEDLQLISQPAPALDAGRFRSALARVAAEVGARVQAGSAASSEYVRSVVTAIKRIPGTQSAEDRIGCLLDASHYFYVTGQGFAAIDPASEAVRLADKANIALLHRKALTLLGVTQADTGNISAAVECYAKALDLSRQLGDRASECIVWINLGVALLYAAQYRDAIVCFEHAIDMSANAPALAAIRPNAYSNIALCALHLEDFGRGIRAAETAVRESATPVTAADKLSRVLRENYYTRLLLEVNNLDKARERCEIARVYARESQSPRAEIAAAIAEGLYEVHAGKVDVGISRLTATLERARQVRSMLRDTLGALVKAFELVGQPERALIYLREMMEAIKQTQQENALNHVKRHLETLGQVSEGKNSEEVRLARQEAALRGKVAEQELFRSRIEMLERLAVTAELRDDSTGEHSYRVGMLSGLIAEEYGCDHETCFMVELAARLHDIGKIGVPDAILLKPDKLNDSERQIMRTHTTVGAELLSKSNIPHMQMAEEIARHHHEWWDGGGYPGNVSGSAIPLSARITALADVFDALTHKRPYKEPWPIDNALAEIARLKSSQFDPQLTDVFLVLIAKLRKQYMDLDGYLGKAAQASPFLQARSKIWETLRKSKEGGETGSGSRLDLQR